MESFAREHHAGFHQLFVELAHFGQKLLVWHYPCFRLLAGLNQDHKSHRHPSFFILEPCGPHIK